MRCNVPVLMVRRLHLLYCNLTWFCYFPFIFLLFVKMYLDSAICGFVFSGEWHSSTPCVAFHTLWVLNLLWSHLKPQENVFSSCSQTWRHSPRAREGWEQRRGARLWWESLSRLALVRPSFLSCCLTPLWPLAGQCQSDLETVELQRPHRQKQSENEVSWARIVAQRESSCLAHARPWVWSSALLVFNCI